MYYDAKPSTVDADNLFEGKPGGGASGTQEPMKYDFERAKLKFDRSTSGKDVAGSSKAGTRHSASSKRNSGDCSLFEKKNYESVQNYDENLKRTSIKEPGSNFMKTSMNLDGLKVSDDEEVSNSRSDCFHLVLIIMITDCSAVLL